MSDKIADSLGMRPIEGEVLPAEVEEVTDHEVDDDLEFVRKNLRDLINKSQDILDEYTNIAGQGQTAREYEVLSNIIKTVLDANKELIDFNKKKRDIKPAPLQGASGGTINNYLTVTTADLQRMIREAEDVEEEPGS